MRLPDRFRTRHRERLAGNNTGFNDGDDGVNSGGRIRGAGGAARDTTVPPTPAVPAALTPDTPVPQAIPRTAPAPRSRRTRRGLRGERAGTHTGHQQSPPQVPAAPPEPVAQRYPLGDVDVERAVTRHLLVVCSQVADHEVDALVSCLAYSNTDGPLPVRATPGRYPLSPEGVVCGPWRATREHLSELGLDAWVNLQSVAATIDSEGTAAYVYELWCPVMRGGPLPPVLMGMDPILDLMADAIPVEAEALCLSNLMSLARRLYGCVRVAGAGVGVVPDPLDSPDLTLYSPVWLDHDATGVALAAVFPGVSSLLEDLPEELGSESLDGYGLAIDMDDGDRIVVYAQGEEHVPAALTGVPWAEAGLVTYAVRWHRAEELDFIDDDDTADYDTDVNNEDDVENSAEPTDNSVHENGPEPDGQGGEGIHSPHAGSGVSLAASVRNNLLLAGSGEGPEVRERRALVGAVIEQVVRVLRDHATGVAMDDDGFPVDLPE